MRERCPSHSWRACGGRAAPARVAPEGDLRAAPRSARSAGSVLAPHCYASWPLDLPRVAAEGERGEERAAAGRPRLEALGRLRGWVLCGWKPNGRQPGSLAGAGEQAAAACRAAEAFRVHVCLAKLRFWLELLPRPLRPESVAQPLLILGPFGGASSARASAERVAHEARLGCARG